MKIIATNNQQTPQPLVKDNIQVIGRYSTWIPTIAAKLNKLAIPAFIILALSNIPGAVAGPMAYAACTTLCLGFASPFLAPICMSACLPALVAPTP